jgi:peptidoglycan/LPS O-acetylase OafA/YrhL
MKKEIAKGAIIGLLIPLLFAGLLYLGFYLFDKTITDQVLSSGLLFALGINALVMRFYFKKERDYPARGIMLASFVCFIFLVVKFVIYD